jgi:DNA mismatch repair protein MutS2
MGAGLDFSITQKTLERLEWPRLAARLAAAARTPGGRASLAPLPGGDPAAGFAPNLDVALERHAETAEALAILAAGDSPPLGGIGEVSATLARARKRGVLEPEALLDLRGTLAALRESAAFLEERREEAPRLAQLAAAVREQAGLERRIEATFEPSGELRDSASPELAQARRESRSVSAEIQQRLERLLQDPDLRSRLSDAYFTVRNDRYVLPVRAEARSGVRGILHDASRSGTTVFVEPEALVDLNNRLRQAALSVQRESLRVLEELSAAAGAAADEIEAGIAALVGVDLAFARAALAQELRATRPEVGSQGMLRAFGLRHPLLPGDEAVGNDVRLGESYQILVLSGPNAGGKTVALKSVALAALCVRAGLFVPAEPGARVDFFDAVLADIGDEQDIRESLSTFSAHMANLSRIVAEATPRSLVVLDEIGTGTDPSEGAAVAQAILEALADRGARVITTTHFNLLKEMAEVDARFANASFEFDPETLAPTYRLRVGHPGASSALAVAARMGLDPGVLARANQLLDREDRRLDRMLSELAASRAALEHEQREAGRARAASEAVRAEYEAKLSALQQRRETLYRSMREDLERGFREAREQVAAVVRELQSGGSARDATRAQQRLSELAAEQREVEREVGIEAGAGPAAAPPLPPLDWRRARIGDAVAIRGGGEGRLLALPDQRGRVAVGVGAARLIVPMARVGAGSTGEPSPSRPAQLHRETLARLAGAEAPGSQRCDLRGLRVEEALDRLAEELDRAAALGSGSVTVVHGIGTGALRDAVRRHMKESRYVIRFGPGEPAEGGEGVTIARLEP